ncbi:MAG TPA: hypothetical protein VMU66_09025 [Gaiellales bacterium]|nr:hypothetical protein [Gaiellales bacterium]
MIILRRPTGPTFRVRLLAATAVLLAWLLAAAPAVAQLQPAPQPSWYTNGAVKAVVVLHGVVYLGGTFTAVSDSSGQTVARTDLAAIDAATGVVTSWNPRAAGPVLALATDGADTVYAGGPFTSVGGLPRHGLAAISTSGTVLPWQGQVGSGEVHALRFAPGRLYVGGGFAWVDGVRRSNLAAVDPVSGALLGWNPAPDGIVWAIRVDAAHVFVGGRFQHVGSSRQSHIAALDPATGLPLPWSYYPYRAAVLSLTEADGLLVAGLAGNGGRVIAMHVTGGRLAWARWTDGNVKAVAIADGQVVAGGHFMNLCSAGSGEPCNEPIAAHHLFAADLRTGLPSGWHPPVNGVLGAFALFGTSSALVVGGDFTTVSGANQPYYARFVAGG